MISYQIIVKLKIITILKNFLTLFKYMLPWLSLDRIGLGNFTTVLCHLLLWREDDRRSSGNVHCTQWKETINSHRFDLLHCSKGAMASLDTDIFNTVKDRPQRHRGPQLYFYPLVWRFKGRFLKIMSVDLVHSLWKRLSCVVVYYKTEMVHVLCQQRE